MRAPARKTAVPKAMQPAYDAVTSLTDAVCAARLDDEYRDLARAMTAALCRKRPSPLASGQPRTWACGIVYALGQLNFLQDKSFKPYMSTADLCAAFGVGVSTVRWSPDFGQSVKLGSPDEKDGPDGGQAEAVWG